MRWDNLTLPGRDTLSGVEGHACRSCPAGDTPILMADGRTTPLAEVCVGDEIYGTVRDGGERRYVRTVVLAHSRVVKPAHRVTLADGTELVASGDQRFLTDLGWKHVTAEGCRPYLAMGDDLVGTGRFAAPLGESADYRQGYLSGIVRGDAGLSLVDREALRRASRYFMDAGAPIREMELQPAGGPRRGALRRQVQAGFEAITEIISRPSHPSGAWSTGFLAGIFDAEGSGSGGALWIANTDSEIIESVLSSLRCFDFTCSVEHSGSPDGPRRVRVLGGISEQLRFFHTVDPAISRKRSIAGVVIDNQRTVVSIENFGTVLPMYDITTGTGDVIVNGMVSHHCFARRTPEYLDLDGSPDLDSKIDLPGQFATGSLLAGGLIGATPGGRSWSGVGSPPG